MQHFATFKFAFSVCFFLNGINFDLLPDLLNNGFAIFETDLFYGSKHNHGRVNMQIPDIYWQDMHGYTVCLQYSITMSLLSRQHVKTLQILIEFF